MIRAPTVPLLITRIIASDITHYRYEPQSAEGAGISQPDRQQAVLSRTKPLVGSLSSATLPACTKLHTVFRLKYCSLTTVVQRVILRLPHARPDEGFKCVVGLARGLDPPPNRIRHAPEFEGGLFRRHWTQPDRLSKAHELSPALAKKLVSLLCRLKPPADLAVTPLAHFSPAWLC
jgi:hypothetical protein